MTLPPLSPLALLDALQARPDARGNSPESQLEQWLASELPELSEPLFEAGVRPADDAHGPHDEGGNPRAAGPIIPRTGEKIPETGQ